MLSNNGSEWRETCRDQNQGSAHIQVGVRKLTHWKDINQSFTMRQMLNSGRKSFKHLYIGEIFLILSDFFLVIWGLRIFVCLCLCFGHMIGGLQPVWVNIMLPINMCKMVVG